METAPAIAVDTTEASGEQFEVSMNASQACAEDSIASRSHETEGPLLATDLDRCQGTEDERRPRQSLLAWAGAFLVAVALVAASSAAALHWATLLSAAKGKQQAGFLHQSDDMGATSAKIALPENGWPSAGESDRQDRDGLIVKLPGSGDDELAVPAQCGFMEDSVEYPGNDLERAKPVAHAEACCQRCSAREDCIAWSFIKPTSACHLKGGKPRPAVTRIFNVQSVSGMPTQVSRSIPRIQRSPGQSLLCVSLVLPWGYEHGLLRMQYTKGASIFACDEYQVFSDGDNTLSPGPPVRIGTTDIGSVHCDYGGVWHLALNSKVFIKVWDKIFEEKKYKSCDWTVKADPDAVFIPNRLRSMVTSKGAEASVYLNNCDQGLHGPLEVISLGGMKVFDEGVGECKEKLSYEFWQWGEDVFLRHCLGLLKVNRVDNFKLLSEDRCMYENPAQQGCYSGKVAFHPFKDPEKYMKCLEQATKGKAPHKK
mmetsp:Transcript_78566/g.155644  ORF Transcript_78566/g.155644 Transcript_78566/m.155644 type:complete len:483 (-) Transcript_78566:152-1600(-)